MLLFLLLLDGVDKSPDDVWLCPVILIDEKFYTLKQIISAQFASFCSLFGDFTCAPHSLSFSIPIAFSPSLPLSLSHTNIKFARWRSILSPLYLCLTAIRFFFLSLTFPPHSVYFYLSSFVIWASTVHIFISMLPWITMSHHHLSNSQRYTYGSSMPLFIKDNAQILFVFWGALLVHVLGNKIRSTSEHKSLFASPFITWVTHRMENHHYKIATMPRTYSLSSSVSVCVCVYVLNQLEPTLNVHHIDSIKSTKSKQWA